VLGKNYLTGTLLNNDPPDSSVWVEVELTKDAIVVLTESMRAVTALRDFSEQDGTQDLSDPVCLINRVRALPEALRRLVGKIWMPDDDGQALIDAIRAGKRVYGVSDGSASKGAATHGWKSARGAEDPLAIKGCGPVDGFLPS